MLNFNKKTNNKRFISLTTFKISSHERARKIFEARSFAAEEKLELLVAQMEEATIIAEEAERKFEEVVRKQRIVEADFERINDKAEEFESKVSSFEMNINENNEKLKKMEEVCGNNSVQEDKYDNEIRSLSENLKTAETAAEFGERTVDKLERNIDVLQESLYTEKCQYRDLSIKLDATLEDMMCLAKEACDQ